MPGFDSIIGQQLPVRLLQTFLRNGKIPHALLFTGMAGIGKRTTAKILAAALNCFTKDQEIARGSNMHAKPCKKCRTCQQIMADKHPDVLRINPRGTLIRIDQIRDLLNTLTLRPFAASYRIVIISDAQAMNQEAGNALLKALEEPPAHTILILTALQRTDLLPTIVSRCQHIRFNPLQPMDIANLLKDDPNLNADQVQIIARLANGSFIRARELMNANWIEQRNWLIHAAGLDYSLPQQPRPMAMAFALSAQLTGKKDQVAEYLEILKIWIHDLSVFRYSPQSVINFDCWRQLQEASHSMDVKYAVILWDAVEKAQKDIAANANLRLTLDLLALRLAGHAPVSSE